MLRRLSAGVCRCALMDSGRAPDRIEAVLEVARWSPEGTAVRLGHESVGCRWRDVGRECPGLGLPVTEGVERRARLRPLNEDGAFDTSETW